MAPAGQIPPYGYALNNIVYITASETYNRPVYVNAFLIECVAGGGAGGGTPATNASGVGQCAAAGGGRGGSYASSFITDSITSLGSSYTVTIGSGGVGVAGAAGGDGADTSFGTLVIAGAGKGAPVAVKDIGSFPDTSGALGGANNTSTGNIIIQGGISVGGLMLTNAIPVSGVGGPAPIYGGIRLSGGTGVTSAGSPGLLYGSGGGGATAIASAAAQKGGDGAHGVCVVWEYIRVRI